MTACTFPKLDAAACTERGKRPSLEDHWGIGEHSGSDTTAYVVADGLGGHTGGDAAAQRAVQCVLDFAPGPGALAEVARAAVLVAHEAVLDEQRVTRLDCRTTLALLLVRGNQAAVAHVGDSRVYRVRLDGTRGKGRLFQPALLARDHRDENGVLLRSLGNRRDAHSFLPDVLETDAQPGDVFILVTDGVWEALGHKGVAQVALDAHPALNARWMAEELVGRALEKGSADNCTAVVVRVPGGIEPRPAPMDPVPSTPALMGEPRKAGVL